MRLWTLHPRYLDRQGILALWREGLLARAVLAGRTRGYAFDRGQLDACGPCPPLAATRGQLLHEWRHLRRKLRVRSPPAYRALRGVAEPDPHPLFRVLPGPIAEWERGR
ncbi:MAG TPA: pyrimidine dimer DNA glycosylase/endonuclease V [Thermoanaerobaculia bacterium]|nr:pyrimidine dimer DNA glycosylase/endonuclease V [Thermoanaerobaculia bacterium]